MQFRPSALSNPNLQRVGEGTVAVPPVARRSGKVEEIIAKVTEKEETGGESEGLPMPVKVAIGLGLAGALGFLVFKLVK